MHTRFLQPLACAILAAALCLQPLAGGDIKVDGKLVSTAPTGTPPLQVDSTTLVPNLNAEFLNGLPASAFETPVANVVHVGKSGAAFTSVQAALDSITDADFFNPYVVLVGPGFYNESITLKSFVSVVGYGPSATWVVAEGPGEVTAVEGALLAVLSDVTIVADSTDGGNATGVNVNSSGVSVQRAKIDVRTGSAGEAIAVRAAGNVGVDLVDVFLQARGGDVNTGIYMETPADVRMVGGEIEASSFAAGATNYGVHRVLVEGFSNLVMDGVEIETFDGATAYGVRSEDGPFRLRLVDVDIDAETLSVGVWNGSGTGTHTVEGSHIEAGNTAIELAAGTITARNSVLAATNAVAVASGATAKLAYNRLHLFLTGTGTFQCIGNYDSNMAAASCP